MSKNNEQPKKLTEEELKKTNGGEDRSSLTGIVGGSVGITNTDDDGETESTKIDFGTGGLLDSRTDD